MLCARKWDAQFCRRLLTASNRFVPARKCLPPALPTASNGCCTESRNPPLSPPSPSGAYPPTLCPLPGEPQRARSPGERHLLAAGVTPGIRRHHLHAHHPPAFAVGGSGGGALWSDAQHCQPLLSTPTGPPTGLYSPEVARHRLFQLPISACATTLQPSSHAYTGNNFASNPETTEPTTRRNNHDSLAAGVFVYNMELRRSVDTTALQKEKEKPRSKRTRAGCLWVSQGCQSSTATQRNNSCGQCTIILGIRKPFEFGHLREPPRPALAATSSPSRLCSVWQCGHAESCSSGISPHRHLGHHR